MAQESRNVFIEDELSTDEPLSALGLLRRSECADAAEGFLLSNTDGALDLRPPGEHGRPGIRALFPPDRGAGGRNPLVRAFGKRITAIYDLTAGLGGDAYRLARAGYRVRAGERDPVVFALLASGWGAALRSGSIPAEVADRLEFVRAEGRMLLDSVEGEDQGVYVDPMYPAPRRRSARPRRALQVLRALLGDEDVPAELVGAARARAARVVVKRPHHAAPVVEGVSFAVESKLVRFDVYANPERMSGSTS